MIISEMAYTNSLGISLRNCTNRDLQILLFINEYIIH